MVVSYCKNLTDAILSHSKGWETIEFVNFQRCTGLTDTGFESWSFNSLGLPSLEEVKRPVSNSVSCLQTSAQPSKPLVLFQTRALHELVISDCSFLSVIALKSIACVSTDLTRLNLSFCCSLNESFASILVASCVKLQVLDLSFCGCATTDKSLLVLAQGLGSLLGLSIRG